MRRNISLIIATVLLVGVYFLGEWALRPNVSMPSVEDIDYPETVSAPASAPANKKANYRQPIILSSEPDGRDIRLYTTDGDVLIDTNISHATKFTDEDIMDMRKWDAISPSGSYFVYFDNEGGWDYVPEYGLYVAELNETFIIDYFKSIVQMRFTDDDMLVLLWGEYVEPFRKWVAVYDLPKLIAAYPDSVKSRSSELPKWKKRYFNRDFVKATRFSLTVDEDIAAKVDRFTIIGQTIELQDAAGVKLGDMVLEEIYERP